MNMCGKVANDVEMDWAEWMKEKIFSASTCRLHSFQTKVKLFSIKQTQTQTISSILFKNTHKAPPIVSIESSRFFFFLLQNIVCLCMPFTIAIT